MNQRCVFIDELDLLFIEDP